MKLMRTFTYGLTGTMRQGAFVALGTVDSKSIIIVGLVENDRSVFSVVNHLTPKSD